MAGLRCNRWRRDALRRERVVMQICSGVLDAATRSHPKPCWARKARLRLARVNQKQLKKDTGDGNVHDVDA